MKAVIAIDSFKGSLSSVLAANAVSEGIKAVFPKAQTVISPLADGGEGTVQALVDCFGGELRTVKVHGPLDTPVDATYGVIRRTNTAIIEMAAASGITLIDKSDRNPLFTSTYGVGELIADAIEQGCRNFIVGVGGSATNDGGVGMLSALGVQFLDVDGLPVRSGAIGLRDIVKINTNNTVLNLDKCHFSVACDVKNVLCGENGCSAVFGPQKGATPQMIADMDRWLSHYAHLTKAILPLSDATLEGSGAAGGLGFAFTSYLGAELRSGIELVMQITELEKHIIDADVVITGEGRLDAQSCMGKAPVGVAALAKKHGKPVIAFSGCIGNGAESCNQHGIDAYFPILPAPCTVEQAMEENTAYKNLKSTAEQAFRLFKTALACKNI